MFVKQAKEIARQWVLEQTSQLPGFQGAHFGGSINWLPDDVPFPTTSDVDVVLLWDDPKSRSDASNFLHRGLLLEVRNGASAYYQNPEAILSNYTLACHLAQPSIILDPTGLLTRLHAEVSRLYARRSWVLKRCEHAHEWFLASLKEMPASAPFHDQLFAFLYPLVVPAHMILVAGLKNPTMRRCLATSREVLTEYTQLPLHESMLKILGCAGMNREQVAIHLDACSEAFDIATKFLRTPFFGATWISAPARPLSIQGSWEMIENGYPREAVFWIVTVLAWCQKALHNDAPADVQRKYAPALHKLAEQLNLGTPAELHQRRNELRELQQQVWIATENIVAANPGITD